MTHYETTLQVKQTVSVAVSRLSTQRPRVVLKSVSIQLFRQNCHSALVLSHEEIRPGEAIQLPILAQTELISLTFKLCIYLSTCLDQRN